MCGIVGLFLKDKKLQPQLGALLADMLVTMSDRGPDSAGIAIYQSEEKGQAKITLQINQQETDLTFKDLLSLLHKQFDSTISLMKRDNHAIITMPAKYKADILVCLRAMGNIRIMSEGDSIEIYKEVGLPKDVVQRFEIEKMAGSHAIGHTRMATESTVTTMGAHPFSTGADQCLVHNGSLCNHNNWRRELIRQGVTFETENDTEVGAAYISKKLAEGANLRDALEQSNKELDGFFTFVVGTKSGFGVLRDSIACKPAVLAETDQYVAMGSEYRALVNLPNIDKAKIWEPEPATVYFWEHNHA